MQRGLAERQSRSGGWAPLTAALARDPPGLGPVAQDLDKRCASSSLADESILGEGDNAKLEMKASAHRSARTASQRLPAGSLRSTRSSTGASARAGARGSQLITDKEATTLALIDRGCGMSKEDLINQLGAPHAAPPEPQRLRAARHRLPERCTHPLRSAPPRRYRRAVRRLSSRPFTRAPTAT